MYARNSRATRSLTGSQRDRRRGIVLVRRRPSSSEQDRRVRRLGTRTPQTWCRLGSREGHESAKPKEYFSLGKPGHSKSEYRYFSAVRKKRLAQQDKADRHTAGDPEMGKTEFLGERGTSVLSIIPERDVCLFHEDDNDQSVYPCPSPLIDRGSDDLEDLVVLPCQVWFAAEAPESFECDGLDATATTEQHLSTLARLEVRIASPREISANSKFLNTSVGTQKVEGEFAVRNVTNSTKVATRD